MAETEIGPISFAEREELHAMLVAAFADYPVPMKPTLVQLLQTFTRRGVCWELSCAARSQGEMVGAMVVGEGTMMSLPTAYDITTGVRPEFQGQGLAGQLLRRVQQQLGERGVQHLLLEVLQENEPAVRAYRREGFEVTREFLCFEIDKAELLKADGGQPGGVTIEAVDRDLEAWQGFWDWQPSWQNSSASVERSPVPVVCLGARRGEEIAGYALVVAESGDVPQLAVQRGARRQEVGRALLQGLARQGAPEQPLRLLNIDAKASGDLTFLRACGAHEITRQYEMMWQSAS